MTHKSGDLMIWTGSSVLIVIMVTIWLSQGTLALPREEVKGISYNIGTQNYTSDEGNFAFEYPSSYQITKVVEDSRRVTVISFYHEEYNLNLENKGTDKYNGRNFTLTFTKTPMPLEDYAQDLLNEETVTKTDLQEIGEHVFSVYQVSGQGPGRIYYFVKGSNGLIVSTFIDYTTWNVEDTLFQILASFKFLDI